MQVRGQLCERGGGYFFLLLRKRNVEKLEARGWCCYQVSDCRQVSEAPGGISGQLVTIRITLRHDRKPITISSAYAPTLTNQSSTKTCMQLLNQFLDRTSSAFLASMRGSAQKTFPATVLSESLAQAAVRVMGVTSSHAQNNNILTTNTSPYAK